VVSSFESKIPFQSYLIAIIAGDVQQKQLGKRTYVITEPEDIDRCATELADLEAHLTTLENYIGPYMWGDYKLVILPPSFPFGGMENPLLTFASPSIIVGDKSGVSVAIHEIAHSWTGNSVTCINWSNFWLNEGYS
jgi:leukotriene-A4 hydrolase